MNKRELLDRFARNGDQRLLLARVLDQQQRAEQRGVPTHTGFLSPAEQAQSADILMAAAPRQGILFGGYPEAERKLWAFLPDWMEEETWQMGEDCPVCALEVKVPREADLSHRDYLGSLMGLGLTREKLGDILLTEGGAQILVLREALPILLSQWEKAGRYPVRLRELPLEGLTPAPGEVKQVRATVATQRLDAVLAAGFSIPRSRAAELIRAGRVMVNHRPCEKGDKALGAGDVLTCRGLGKCVLTQVGGTSRHGRTIVELERYI
ncbi:MAG: RNA-binding protein [Ruminiclostridium sp.]|nr:RNA-binding protein [Ruminiclostridium sp.]